MASSPAHKFGQLLGDLLEEIISPLLQSFCAARGLYLDKQGERPARKGQKVTWLDQYENSHDLDFVIEKNGSDDKVGRPVAFIEAAWRRYTKHSKNKAQEIQGAILPIADRFEWDKPFMGAILAGLFTEPSLKQMESSGFTVALFSYETIITAFASAHVNVRFDESTPDQAFSKVISQIERLSENERSSIKDSLVRSNKPLIDKFFSNLKATLDRQIEEIILIPLYGKRYAFESIDAITRFVLEYKNNMDAQDFISFKLYVTYTNGSNIKSEFCSKEEVFRFLQYISG